MISNLQYRPCLRLNLFRLQKSFPLSVRHHYYPYFFRNFSQVMIREHSSTAKLEDIMSSWINFGRHCTIKRARGTGSNLGPSLPRPKTTWKLRTWELGCPIWIFFRSQNPVKISWNSGIWNTLKRFYGWYQFADDWW